MSILDCERYRAVLEQKIQDHEHVRGYKSILARNAGIHQSYLSQVLSGAAELTLDQAAKLASFWSLNEQESEYFILLVSRDKSTSSELTELLNRRISAVRGRREKTGRGDQESVKINLLTQEKSIRYYSRWYYPAIHILLTIPGFQTPRAISERMDLPLPDVETALAELAGLGLIQKQKGRWSVVGEHTATPSRGVMSPVQQMNWLQRAIFDVQNEGADSTHLNMIASLNRRDLQKVRAIMVEAFERVRHVVSESKNEDEMIALTISVFRV